MLACAPSNSACDLLCERLMVHMDPYQVYRLYANSRDPKSVPKDLLVSHSWPLIAHNNLVTCCKAY